MLESFWSILYKNCDSYKLMILDSVSKFFKVSMLSLLKTGCFSCKIRCEIKIELVWSVNFCLSS